MQKNFSIKNVSLFKIEAALAVIFLVFTFILLSYAPTHVSAEEAQIEELNQELEDQKRRINELEEKKERYKNTIDEKRSQASTLRNQIAILDAEVEKTTIDVQIKEREIDEQKLSILTTDAQIKRTERNIDENKEQLGEMIRTIHSLDKTSPLEILLTNTTLSDYFRSIDRNAQVQSGLQVNLQGLNTHNTEMLASKSEQESYKESLEVLKDEIEAEKDNLRGKQFVKADLLEETKSSERKFQTLLQQLRGEQEGINSDIVSIEKKIREMLASREREEGLGYLIGESLMWPVPKNKVTAYFHDPDYPYRHVFEHPAIDIRAKQGTSTRAASSGYVARVKYDSGCTGSYAYVVIVHGDGLSSVYGHMSKIYVSEDQFVRQGDAIGLSGAARGTCGSGRLTTGAHMHFEVRKNGIPVDPLAYLP